MLLRMNNNFIHSTFPLKTIHRILIDFSKILVDRNNPKTYFLNSNIQNIPNISE